MRDRVIVITGASSGIGAALAERAAAAGAKTVLAARRRAALDETAARCGADSLVVVADVTRRGEVDGILAEAVKRFGQVDVWVNNAGRGITRHVSELTEADVDEILAVNLKSALYGMQAVLPHFQQRGRGHIINVSSMLGRVPFAPFRSIYSAAKHALNALTANLRMELREAWPEIHVTTVSPGVVSTPFGVNALGGGPDSRALPGAQPVEEVADVILEVIRHPRADVYTRPGMRERAAAYYAAEDMGAIERELVMRPPAKPADSR